MLYSDNKKNANFKTIKLITTWKLKIAMVLYWLMEIR